jgi:four helix bundle protein
MGATGARGAVGRCGRERLRFLRSAGAGKIAGSAYSVRRCTIPLGRVVVRRLRLRAGVGVHRIEDRIAWQLARSFKLEVYRLLQVCPAAAADFQFRDQLRASASSVGMNIAEGFRRYTPREFSRFLTVALSSLSEAMLWLQDGVDRGHFPDQAIAEELMLGRRCYVATIRLKHSLDAGPPR